jgi:PAS domain S-box-containing protein
MDSMAQMGQLLALADVGAAAGDPDAAWETALTALLTIARAESVIVVGAGDPAEDSAAHQVTASSGIQLGVEDLRDLPGTSGRLADVPVPTSWRDRGIGHVAAQQLPGHLGTLLIAWSEHDPELTPELELAMTCVDIAVGRAVAQHELADLSARVDSAQQLAEMGDYDWHIPTDTNTWSDQLFRIYGHEPQSFHPSYERFLSLIHPDDRERISAIHRRAYETGEPFKMIERIVRPSGEVRYLASNGEVIRDSAGTPVRMRGTCIDITDRVLADEEKAQIAARFQSLVESAPDAILVLDEEHRILSCNPTAREMVGGDPRGHSIQEIVPTWPATDPLGSEGRGLDGRELVLDVTAATVTQDEHDATSFLALYLRDAKPRLASEAMASRLGEAQLRRRQALEINDNVVQGLVAASYALEQGDVSNSRTYLDQTLSSARAMMDDLLEPLDGEGLQPGDLVRTAPAAIGVPPETATAHQEETIEPKDTHRVLVVDDAEDLRMLLRARMETRNGLTVVGEAADGLAAVELASELQPDLVMLDLAMPRMDGLEALPLIRAAVPGVRVIVLSGFNQSTLAQKAMEAGADHYVVKGGSMGQLLELVDRVLEQVS